GVTPLDAQQWVCLGKVAPTRGDGDMVTVHEGDSGRTEQVFVERRNACLVCRDLGQRVLHHGVSCVLLDALTKLLELGNREAAVLGQQNSSRVTEQVRKLGNRSFLVRHVAPQ